MPHARISLLTGLILSLGLAGALWAKGADAKKKGTPTSATACDAKKEAAAEKKLDAAQAAKKKAKSAAEKKKADSAITAAQGELAKLGCQAKGKPEADGAAASCDPKKKAAADKKLTAAREAQKKAKSAGDKKQAESAISGAKSELAKLGCKVPGDQKDHAEQVKLAKKQVDDDQKMRKQKADADFNAVLAKYTGVYKTRRDRMYETLRSVGALNEALKSCNLQVVDTGGTTADMRLMNSADQCEPARIRRTNPKFAVAQIGSQMKACMDACEKAALVSYNSFSAAVMKQQGSTSCKAVAKLNKGIASTTHAIEKAGEAEKKAKDAIVKTVKNKASDISSRFRSEAKPLVKSWLLQKVVPLIQDKSEGAIEEQVTGVIGFAVGKASEAAFGVGAKLSAGAEICLYIQPLIGGACGENPAMLAACEAGCEGFAVEAMSAVQREFEKILTDEIYAHVFKPYIHGKSDQVANSLVAAIDGWN